MTLKTMVQSDLVHPWRAASECRLLVDPVEFIPAMLTAIGTAQRYVLLEMYLVESGAVTTRLLDALTAAAERGVRIWIIFDGFGAHRLNNADHDRLNHPNIALTIFHPFSLRRLAGNLVRDHRKLLIIDGKVGFTGGIGWSDGICIDAKEPLAWHDIAVQFAGRILIDWQNMFARQWERSNGVLPELPVPQIPSCEGGSARLVGSQPPLINAIYAHLRQHALVAGQRIWIATAYFLPSWHLRQVLSRAAARGVDVRLLLPGQITDNPAVRYASRRFYLRLLKAGIRIYEYQPTFMHAKAALIDDWVSVGSSNFDRWSRSRNLEGNLEVSDRTFADSIERLFITDFALAEEIRLQEWLQRPVLHRWRENILGTIEAFIDRR